MQAFSRFSRYFMEVARSGSLRRAAEVLHVSASAIDRQILLAEEEYGTALFERLPTGMQLTAAGELLLADLRRWRKEYDRTLERFDELQGLRRGNVSIACMNALGNGVLPVTLAALSAEFPGIGFDLQVTENRHIQTKVSSAEVDFGLVLEPQPSTQLQYRTLCPVALGFAMPTDHPLAAANQLSMGSTLEYRHIVATDSLMIGERTRALYARYQTMSKPRMLCNDVSMMRSLIKAGAGIGILSWLDVAADVAQGSLAFVTLQERSLKPLSLAICIAPQRQLSKAAQLTISRVEAALQAMPRPDPS